MEKSNNTILITGGSAGIGLGMAKRFLARGNKVIVTGRNAEKLDRAKKENPGLETFECDVSDVKAIESLAKDVAKQFPGLNVLINNAGVFIGQNLTATTKDLAGLTKELDINVAGTMRTTSAFMNTIKANKGTIINVSSGLAFVPLIAAPIYCATKAAIHSYSKTLRQQCEDVGVSVIEVAPPAVKTDMTAELPEDGDFKIMDLDPFLDEVFKGLDSGKREIRPGQANQLKFMSRLAPSFIESQLAKGGKALVPPPES